MFSGRVVDGVGSHVGAAAPKPRHAHASHRSRTATSGSALSTGDRACGEARTRDRERARAGDACREDRDDSIPAPPRAHPNRERTEEPRRTGLGHGGEPLHGRVLHSDEDVDERALRETTGGTDAVVMGGRLFDFVTGSRGRSDDLGNGAHRAPGDHDVRCRAWRGPGGWIARSPGTDSAGHRGPLGSSPGAGGRRCSAAARPHGHAAELRPRSW